MNSLFESTRHFQAWRYGVSHGQLLLRSVPTKSDPRRIEVLFKNVRVLKMSMEADGLMIRDPYHEELLRIRQEVGDALSGVGVRAFIVGSSKFQGYVIASSVVTAVDDGDYKTPSSLFIGD